MRRGAQRCTRLMVASLLLSAAPSESERPPPSCRRDGNSERRRRQGQGQVLHENSENSETVMNVRYERQPLLSVCVCACVCAWWCGGWGAQRARLRVWGTGRPVGWPQASRSISRSRPGLPPVPPHHLPSNATCIVAVSHLTTTRILQVFVSAIRMPRGLTIAARRSQSSPPRWSASEAGQTM
jgi:hypothetical protein